MLLDEFRRRFAPGIRAWLDWGALERAGAPVSVETTEGAAAPDALGRLLTVWYRAPDGGDGDWWGRGGCCWTATTARRPPGWRSARAGAGGTPVTGPR
ncbi:hypothetical protein [Phaeacidiphilus oryzae]|uniref:hypothetical protein n=1 Tax=Phaeacidiphilus oryzae TaxID=348818 RepID=UPI00056BD284|nr:hypothetical protein [Phaeacidiphilus oryzae]